MIQATPGSQPAGWGLDQEGTSPDRSVAELETRTLTQIRERSKSPEKSLNGVSGPIGVVGGPR